MSYRIYGDIIYNEACTVIARYEATCVTNCRYSECCNSDCFVPRNDGTDIFKKTDNHNAKI